MEAVEAEEFGGCSRCSRSPTTKPATWQDDDVESTEAESELLLEKLAEAVTAVATSAGDAVSRSFFRTLQCSATEALTAAVTAADKRDLQERGIDFRTGALPAL